MKERGRKYDKGSKLPVKKGNTALVLKAKPKDDLSNMKDTLFHGTQNWMEDVENSSSSASHGSQPLCRHQILVKGLPNSLSFLHLAKGKSQNG